MNAGESSAIRVLAMQDTNRAIEQFWIERKPHVRRAYRRAVVRNSILKVQRSIKRFINWFKPTGGRIERFMKVAVMLLATALLLGGGVQVVRVAMLATPESEAFVTGQDPSPSVAGTRNEPVANVAETLPALSQPKNDFESGSVVLTVPSTEPPVQLKLSPLLSPPLSNP